MTPRRQYRLAACAFGVIASLYAASAQNVPVVVAHPVTVGAITRDAGVYNLWIGPKDLPTIQAVNRSLVVLESDLAEALSSVHNISYQDRTATKELLDEVHMSSGRDFDQTTGALRGLMGRLDFLVVIDGVDASTAKMRLIDVETGSVKGVETCKRGANAACVKAMSGRIETVVREYAGLAGKLAAQRQEMMTVKPQWDDQVARFEAAKAYWAGIQKSISAGGHALRPEIQTLLNGGAKDVETGSFAVQTLDVPTLKTAVQTLQAKLDKLDQFR